MNKLREDLIELSVQYRFSPDGEDLILNGISEDQAESLIALCEEGRYVAVKKRRGRVVVKISTESFLKADREARRAILRPHSLAEWARVEAHIIGFEGRPPRLRDMRQTLDLWNSYWDTHINGYSSQTGDSLILFSLDREISTHNWRAMLEALVELVKKEVE